MGCRGVGVTVERIHVAIFILGRGGLRNVVAVVAEDVPDPVVDTHVHIQVTGFRQAKVSSHSMGLMVTDRAHRSLDLTFVY